MSEIFIASHDSQLKTLIKDLAQEKIILFENMDQLEGPAEDSVNWPDARIALFDITEDWADTETLFQNIKKHYKTIVIADEDTIEQAAFYLNHGACEFYLKPLHPGLLKKRLKSITNSSIHDFMRFATHELRNPLVSITGYATLLLDAEDSLDAAQKNAFIEVIQANAERMNSLISDLRDMAFINAERIALQFQPISLEVTIHEAFTAHQNEINEKNQQVDLLIEDDLPSVQADPKRLYQIIYVLIDNAVRYTHENGYILLSAYPVDDGFVTFAIQDGGVGILEEEQEKVFNQRRFRSTDPYVIEQRGNGLSLYIIFQLVQEHGGRIWFESTPGRGSTFYVALPQAKQ